MAEYRCPLCNRQVTVDTIEELGDVITCNFCGSSIGIKQLIAYSQKKETDSQKTEITLQSDEIVSDTNYEFSDDKKDEMLFLLQKRQLEELVSIKKMLKFFTVLTVISLVASFISVISIMSNF